MRQATQRKPACLPEQLLCSALGSLAARGQRARDRLVVAASARRIRARSASSPALRQHARDDAHVCIGSPLCEAQAIASSSSLRPSRSAAPLVDQRQRLQHLDRRAREDRPLDVAERREHARRRHRRRRSRRDAPIRAMPPRITSTRIGFIGVHGIREPADCSRRSTTSRAASTGAAGDNRPHVGHGPGPRPLRRAAACVLERGRQAHRRRRRFALIAALFLVVRVGAARHLGGLGRGAALGRRRMGGAARQRGASTSSTSRPCCAATASPTSPSSTRWRAAPGRCWRRSARCSGSARSMSAGRRAAASPASSSASSSSPAARACGRKAHDPAQRARVHAGIGWGAATGALHRRLHADRRLRGQGAG